jgi:16S rRNA processing protein RimM
MHRESSGDPKGAGNTGEPKADPYAGEGRGDAAEGSERTRRSGECADASLNLHGAGYVPSSETLVCVGKIVKTRGTGGELEVDLLGETAPALDEPLTVFLEETGGAQPKAYAAERRRRMGRRMALKLEGIDAPEAAQGLVGYSVMVEARRLPALPEGQFYHYQIIGLDVIDEDGKSLGRIEEVMETGGNDVYVVRSGRGEVLIPAVDNVVLKVDLDAGCMVVDLPPGLVE